MTGQGGKLVGRADQRQAAQGREFGGDGYGKALGRVESGTDGSTALGQFANRRQGGTDRPLGMLELGDEGREFLAESDRGGIHHVGAAGLQQFAVASGLLGEPCGQFGQGRQQVMLHGAGRGDVHGRGEAVVGALRAVDVVIRVYRALAATWATGEFVGAAGDHFVDVHIALGTTAGLPDRQRELRVVLASQHLVGGLFDQAGDVQRQVADAGIDPRSGFLDQGQGMQHGQRHALLADGEIDQRTLGLRAPVGCCRYFDGA
ncbi:hypothetical protein D3C85_890240 [compost metagenome]